MNRLLRILRRQKTDDVEILVNVDDGKISTGEKRNKLLERSVGDYIVFVDDDDIVPIDYVKKILIALKTNPDCCGIEGQLINRKGKYTFFHSIKYKSWFSERGIYFRSPNHISPVKRTLALQIGFKFITVGEDKDYSARLLPLLKTEVEIPGILYYYIAG